MSVELIFKTTDPRVLAWWESVLAHHAEIRERRNAYADRISDELGTDGNVRPLYETRLFLGGSYIDGVGAIPADYRRPAGELLAMGWRIDSKTNHLKPALKTEAGKAIRKEWGTLDFLNKEKQAINFGVLGEFRGPFDEKTGKTLRYFPGFTIIDGALYVTYGSSYGEKEVGEALSQSTVDWVRITTSEWREIAKKEENS
jgi:hypothetical protein